MKRKSHHCGRFRTPGMTRRDWLAQAGCGFGSVALTAMLANERLSGAQHRDDDTDSQFTFAPKPTHFPAKVERVIYLYMDGGPSQVDTWDPKPRLKEENGKPFGLEMEPTQFNNNGNTLASPWEFKQYGESSIPVSDLFPNIAEHVDDMAVIRSMVSEFSEHTNANYFLHTGIGIQGRPSMGAWMGYGLGSMTDNLPAFVVLNGGLIPPGGLDCFNSGFLPAAYQGSIFNSSNQPIANVSPREANARLQENKLKLLGELDESVLESYGRVDQLESAISNYELAYRMQSAVPELADISDETDETRALYGIDAESKGTATFGRQCLIARRLVERGVRFIELTCSNVGHDRWDQHGNLQKGHADNAMAVDQPIGALLTDLKRTGLFDSTLVVWSGEFGRTPFAQGSNGRDHNPFGFSLWMAGGGIKGGTIHGATDDYGYKTIDGRVEIYDLHATMLHLLGMDHKRMTFRFSGRDMRLTDVHGKVVHEVLS